MNTIINVQKISKEYFLGKVPLSIREQLQYLFRRNTKKRFLALDDVSFTCEAGEKIGIVGRNGAGKSTLLKILAQITYPSKGRITIRGKVASLLELGTGFHPDLTGRENIFIRGALLGMTKDEIKKQFDKIIDFAGVDQFIDSKLKHYSSGMYVRLGFAIAAFLRQEILLVDEVLAVGDAEFQSRCLGALDNASFQGRTVIFVSHDLGTVKKLCPKAICLDQGKIFASGKTSSVISKYLDQVFEKTQTKLNTESRRGNQSISVQNVSIINNNEKDNRLIQSGNDVLIKLDCRNNTGSNFNKVRIDLAIDNASGLRLSWMSTTLFNSFYRFMSFEEKSIEILIKDLPLRNGTYSITFYLTNEQGIADWIKNAYFFNVQNGDFYTNGVIPKEINGAFLMQHSFLNSEK